MLRQQGLILDEIMGQLADEFTEEDIPDRSTISRHLKKFADDVPPEELREDAPFQWSTMSEVPWEWSRTILEAWWSYEMEGSNSLARKMKGSGSLPFTRRLAKWTWRVAQAFGPPDYSDETFWKRREWHPSTAAVDYRNWNAARARGDPTISDVFMVAQEYSYREIAAAIGLEAFDARSIDVWLAFQPWLSPSRYQAYESIVLEYRKPHSPSRNPLYGSDGDLMYVNWHRDDVEFLSKVSPMEASSIVELNKMREEIRVEREESRLLETDPVKLELSKQRDEMIKRSRFGKSTEAWKRATASLLPSQVAFYGSGSSSVDDTESIGSQRPTPWYFNTLDGAKATTDPESGEDIHER